MSITTQITELHAKGLTNNEIHNIIGGNSRSIITLLNRQGLKSNRHSMLKETEDLEQFIIGSVLGDGYLSKIDSRYRNSRLHFGHSEKQLLYLQHKNTILSTWNLDGKITKYTHISERYAGGQTTSFYLNSKTHPVFNKYRELFYTPEFKKIIPVGSLDKMNDFALAIWYMDDGHVCHRSYQFNTMCFTQEEVEYMLQILKTNFNIDATMDKNKVIYIRTSSKENFENRIRPYVIDSMKYKLRVLNKPDELREYPAVDNPEPSQI